MGTICAPSYANIFMGKFEDTFIYPFIKDLCKLYLRYIDDIFMIWTGTKEQFYQFYSTLNNCHHSIKFDHEISPNEVNFLDTTVYVDTNGTIQTKLYTKPTDRHNYLHRRSEHPLPLKNNLAYSQALRIRRICSNEEHYRERCSELVDNFTSRGYKLENIQSQVVKASSISREQALKSSDKKKSDRIPFITTYNRTLPPISHILRKHWDILKIDPELQNLFSEPPMMAYRRNKNLKDQIGGNTIANDLVCRKNTKPKMGKCSPCNTKAGNLCCKQLLATTQFHSNQTNKTYQILHDVNCKSKLVIYLMECTKCRLQYIGKSETQLNIRINNHRKDSKKTNTILACQHFNNPSHDFTQDARFIIIEQLRKTDCDNEELRRRLETREDFWIRTLQTLRPKGLNQGLNHPF